MDEIVDHACLDAKDTATNQLPDEMNLYRSGAEFSLEHESPAFLSVQQEEALLRSAYERRPSQGLRQKLAMILVAGDNYDEVIELLSDRDDLSFGEAIHFGTSLLSRESRDDDRQCIILADRAAALAATPAARAAALAMRGKAETRLGQRDDARATLTAALDLDPGNKDACKRLAALLLDAGDAAAITTLVADLRRKGAAHARLFAAGALAAARRGDIDGARQAIAAGGLRDTRLLTPPPGFADIHQFNAALAAELLAHPQMRFDRYGTASEQTWRIDWLPHRGAPLVGVLLRMIGEAVSDHACRLAGLDHPWAASRPDEALLRAWCVITEEDGFETWHVHQFGWLSGAYYVQVPDAVTQGEGDAGCIAFGLPDELAGPAAAAAYGTECIRPESGLLLMFPSHTYHRTYPHGASGRRICVAFDVKPLAEA